MTRGIWDENETRVQLAKIPALTFYKDEPTVARRTPALPQLVCIGKPCKLYQPEVVRCVNVGGNGVDVDWKCEADLPSSLRFGKVEVGCEGWSRPGDPYVAKNTCSLEYRLVQIPGALRDSDSPLFNTKSYDWASIAFSIAWIGVLLFIVYSFVQSWLRGGNATNSGNPRPPRPPGYTPGSSGSFPGDYRDDTTDAPPPYYAKPSQAPPQRQGWQSWRPGFWTGAAVGGLANHVLNRTRAQATAPRAYDWEVRPQAPLRPSSLGLFSGRSNSYRRPQSSSEDRGEGSSNLGAMRQSTGLGGSKVR
ncbi:hypothetical protein HYPSUDRAFT_143695 [Hypholoma sublateritium FD-334 SS-4]|uniref:Store-operated calcium entry-associated regulatory factor n=1 Tax=Hypholoma sublateritium (strain FD-334 SS-4) TaxID=945553 RepID=A0A0D2M833_HYPSF|nr:hypothetical protein HYPSUDRAFT_143695 [Hypholoma sublateritium FD-334 SS-4]